MILLPFRRRSQARTIHVLYGAIVAQARSPAFYVEYGVPDTVSGRFDLIVLHLVLLLRRLDREGETMRRLGQALFNAFCDDLDGNLREMGTGDLAVPKHMRRFGEAFYGRQAAYLSALAAAGDRDIEKALARNIFQSSGIDDRSERLACYVRETVRELDAQDKGALGGGAVFFPNAEVFAHA